MPGKQHQTSRLSRNSAQSRWGSADAHKIRLCSFSGVLLPNTSTLAAFGLLLAGSVLPNARRGFCGARRLDSTVFAIPANLFD